MEKSELVAALRNCGVKDREAEKYSEQSTASVSSSCNAGTTGDDAARPREDDKKGIKAACRTWKPAFAATPFVPTEVPSYMVPNTSPPAGIVTAQVKGKAPSPMVNVYPKPENKLGSVGSIGSVAKPTAKVKPET